MNAETERTSSIESSKSREREKQNSTREKEKHNEREVKNDDAHFANGQTFRIKEKIADCSHASNGKTVAI